jgi:sugar transferase (PEP-CTERM/EpsH1 system associated)
VAFSPQENHRFVKILYLTHRIPYPPNKGEKIRVFNQVLYLSKSHNVHVCSFVDDPDDLQHTTKLKEYCASLELEYRNKPAAILLATAAFLGRQPLSIKLFYREALAKRIKRKLAEKFDCVIVSCSTMAQYVSSSSGVPKIIDFIDVDSEKWRAYAGRRSFPFASIYRREANLLGRYEAQIVIDFDHSIASSEAEAAFLRQRARNRPVSVVSNGVDLDYFSLPEVAPDKRYNSTIIFVGVMDYFPNVDAVHYFCDKVFPIVRDSVPQAQFYIVGRNPTRRVKELGRQPNVTVTGMVADVRPYLCQATVAVAPFQLARGVQNKILEAMAVGLPVVGTAETFKGLGATEEDGIRIANDPASFARHVISFLQSDAESLRRFAVQTRSYVEQHHRWEDQGKKLERIMDEVVRKKRLLGVPKMKSARLA